MPTFVLDMPGRRKLVTVAYLLTPSMLRRAECWAVPMVDAKCTMLKLRFRRPKGGA